MTRSSPERNPAEQIFRVLRAGRVTRIDENRDELEAALTEQVRPFWDEPATLHRLTNYAWWAAAATTLPHSA